MIDVNMPVLERPRKYQPRPANAELRADGDSPAEAAAREEAWERYVAQINGG